MSFTSLWGGDAGWEQHLCFCFQFKKAEFIISVLFPFYEFKKCKNKTDFSGQEKIIYYFLIACLSNVKMQRSRNSVHM